MQPEFSDMVLFGQVYINGSGYPDAFPEHFPKKVYIPKFWILPGGVMVTQQVLDLLFQVRVLAG